MIPKEKIKNIPIADVADVLNLSLIRHGNSLQSAQCPAGHESKNGNCFSLNTSANFFQCFSCGIKGDSIKLVEITKGLTFTDSMKWLSDTFGISDDPNYKPVKHDSMTLKKSEWTPKEIEAKESDNLTWQSKALLFISYAEAQLAKNTEQMDYLIKERFLTVETVKHFRIGYNPEKRYKPCNEFGLTGDKVLIPQGWAIPYHVNDRILRLRIRKVAGDPPYHLVRGSHTTPYQIDNGKSLWVIVESELDAFLIHQEVGDQVNVCALGTAHEKPDTVLHEKLIKAEKILCALDIKVEDGVVKEEAGSKAYFRFWENAYPNVFRCPCVRGKDPAEMVRAGVSIKQWLRISLKNVSTKESGKPDKSLADSLTDSLAQENEITVKKESDSASYLSGNQDIQEAQYPELPEKQCSTCLSFLGDGKGKVACFRGRFPNYNPKAGNCWCGVN